MRMLAIETSCDETAAAVVEDGVKILSSVVASSSKMHEKYGGIVPEVAAREQLRCIIPVIREAFEPLETFHATRANEAKRQTVLGEVIKRHIDAIAVTIGPGLVGSLLVGVETAKTIAFVTGKPIVPVNHVLAHMYANFVEIRDTKHVTRKNMQTTKRLTSHVSHITFPAISLLVSGGHTELYLMKSIKDLTWLGGTLDDAAGECFDKTARLLGFGSQGGVAIQEAARSYHVSHITYHPQLPRPMIHDDSLNFSFSGLKTAVMREWKKNGNQKTINAFTHEIQESITDVLVEKTLRAAKQYGVKSILLSGGVAANLRLREKFLSQLETLNSKLSFLAPPKELCTDNAVMIAAAAFFRGTPTDWHDLTAVPNLSVEEI